MISLVLMEKTQLCDVHHILFVKYCIGFPQTQEYNCSRVANISNFIVTFYANNNFYVLQCMTLQEGEKGYGTFKEKQSASVILFSSSSLNASRSGRFAYGVRFYPERVQRKSDCLGQCCLEHPGIDILV